MINDCINPEEVDNEQRQCCASKQSLRLLSSRIRDGLESLARQQWSECIANQVLELVDERRACCVASYVSFRSEVETIQLIRQLLARGVRVVCPAVEGDQLTWMQIGSVEGDLVPGSWGILEPCSGVCVDFQECDLVLLPGLAFDESGGRLGYGRGFYDRAMSTLGPNALSVGLAYEAQIVATVPCQGTDHRVNKVITEERWIECRPMPINNK